MKMKISLSKEELLKIRDNIHDEGIINKINKILKIAKEDLNYTYYMNIETGEKSKRFSTPEEAYNHLKDIITINSTTVKWEDYYFNDIENGIDNDSWYSY